MFSKIKSLASRLPRTGRALFIGVFQLCVIADGAVTLIGLFWSGDSNLANWGLAATIGTSLLFPLAYGIYCSQTPGELNRDSLNGMKAPPTGRATLRFMGTFCAAIILARAIAGATTLDPLSALLPLFGVFVTILVFGILSRLYAARVTMDCDQGIESPVKSN